MRTTLDLPENLLDEALIFWGFRIIILLFIPHHSSRRYLKTRESFDFIHNVGYYSYRYPH